MPLSIKEKVMTKINILVIIILASMFLKNNSFRQKYCHKSLDNLFLLIYNVIDKNDTCVKNIFNRRVRNGV